jgi:hypothetical protein
MDAGDVREAAGNGPRTCCVNRHETLEYCADRLSALRTMILRRVERLEELAQSRACAHRRDGEHLGLDSKPAA